jgi:hypothetical protein
VRESQSTIVELDDLNLKTPPNNLLLLGRDFTIDLSQLVNPQFQKE